jgi:hypothetical protein
MAAPKVAQLLDALTEQVLGAALDPASKQVDRTANAQIPRGLRLQDGWLDLLADKIAERLLSQGSFPSRESVPNSEPIINNPLGHNY